MARSRTLQDLRINKALDIKSKSADNYFKVCQQLKIIQKNLRESGNNLMTSNILDRQIIQLQEARFKLIRERLRLITSVQSVDQTTTSPLIE